MKVKLTLTIEKEIVEKAKKYAKDNGINLSNLIETFLNDISQKENSIKISPKLKRIIGSVKLPKNFNLKYERRNYFQNKYI